MKDIIQSVKTQIGERVGSPLFGAFALSWVTLNHKYLFILCSGDKIETRLKLAKETVFPTWSKVWQDGLMWPAIGALIFLLFYPLLAMAAYWWWEITQVWMKFIKMYIRTHTPVDQDEHNKLIAAYEGMERKQNQEIADLRGEKATLAKDYGKAISREKEIQTELNTLTKRKDALEKKFLQLESGLTKESNRANSYDSRFNEELRNNEQLTIDNEAQKKEIAALQNTIDSFQMRIDRLNEQLKKSAKEYSTLESQIDGSALSITEQLFAEQMRLEKVMNSAKEPRATDLCYSQLKNLKQVQEMTDKKLGDSTDIY